jgi:AdoMet-dependent rRNA methyltransferase SPB1
MDITTDDVKANCDDLKVLGKGDFKTLLKWRLKLREEVCGDALIWCCY